jgi:hypothetical protein
MGMSLRRPDVSAVNFEPSITTHDRLLAPRALLFATAFGHGSCWGLRRSLCASCWIPPMNPAREKAPTRLIPGLQISIPRVTTEISYFGRRQYMCDLRTRSMSAATPQLQCSTAAFPPASHQLTDRATTLSLGAFDVPPPGRPAQLAPAKAM